MRVKLAAVCLLALAACGGEQFQGAGSEAGAGGDAGSVAGTGGTGSAGRGKPQAGRGGSSAGHGSAGEAGELSLAGRGGEGAAEPIGGEGGEPVVEAGRGGTGNSGAGTGGSTGGSAGVVSAAGEGGFGGEPCQPLVWADVCTEWEPHSGNPLSSCGEVSDGCGGAIDCGSCSPEKECLSLNGDWNQCVLREECDCRSHGCGTLPDCPVPTFCGLAGDGTCSGEPDVSPLELFCFHAEVASTSVMRCDVPSPGEYACYSLPADVPTCCAAKEPECRRAFREIENSEPADCSALIAVNLRTGEDCGSCLNDDDVTHYCGPGWATE